MKTDAIEAFISSDKRFLGNVFGIPALSFPCGFSSDGLPIGLQVYGRPFQESVLLRVAHAYQQVSDWHAKRPEPARRETVVT